VHCIALNGSNIVVADALMCSIFHCCYLLGHWEHIFSLGHIFYTRISRFKSKKDRLVEKGEMREKSFWEPRNDSTLKKISANVRLGMCTSIRALRVRNMLEM
jgi:hypothetical protein